MHFYFQLVLSFLRIALYFSTRTFNLELACLICNSCILFSKYILAIYIFQFATLSFIFLNTNSKLVIRNSHAIKSSHHFNAWYPLKGHAYLKVVSAKYLLVSFARLKESTCETRKNVFSFISKALILFLR